MAEFSWFWKTDIFPCNPPAASTIFYKFYEKVCSWPLASDTLPRHTHRILAFHLTNILVKAIALVCFSTVFGAESRDVMQRLHMVTCAYMATYSALGDLTHFIFISTVKHSVIDCRCSECNNTMITLEHQPVFITSTTFSFSKIPDCAAEQNNSWILCFVGLFSKFLSWIPLKNVCKY